VGDLDDDGYHELSTVFQAVSLYEDVIATPADDFTISVSGVADPSTVPLDDRNLAMRAAKVLAAATGYDGGVHLDVRKSVPVAGGMGGGSAGRRGRPRRLQRAVAHGPRPRAPARARRRLGADVPFALMGGTAGGSGAATC
jgi:4-diphosphocytidyl-2-C-methyl-D-erythritol kinase